jgi:MFS family permease
MAGIASLAIAYMLSQFYRSFMAVLTPVLTAELGMTKTALSSASGAWFITFALSQFAIGVCLDRFGPRRTASAFLATGGAGGALLFSAASEPWMVVAAMGLIGIGCAPVLMATYFIYARIYAPARFAVLASWTVGLGTAGNVIGAAPLAAAAQSFGWRPVMATLAVLTLLVAAAVAMLVRDPKAPEGMASDSPGLRGYVDLIRMRVLWPLIPLSALNYAPVTGIRGLWAGPYLSDVYGADALGIGSVTLFMALSMVAGSFIYGPLDTFFGTRKWVALVGNSVTVVVLVVLALHPVAGIPMVTALFVMLGISGGAFGLLMAHARAFVPAHLTGRGVTLMNFFSIGGVGLMQFATGGLVSANTDPIDPSHAYSMLFWFYAMAVGLALTIYLFVRDAPPERNVTV